MMRLRSVLTMLFSALLMLSPSQASDAPTRPDSLQQAEQAYTTSNYDAAIQAYTALVDAGTRNGALFYNLATAYRVSGDPGRALLNYRRAALYTPRDVDVQTAIAQIQAEHTDPIREETNPLLLLTDSTDTTVTLLELCWLALILWLMIGGLGALMIWRKIWRDTLRVLSAGLLLSLILVGGLAGARYYVLTEMPPAVVLQDTQAMSGPGDDYLLLFELGPVSEIRLLESQRDWARFRLPAGQQGWLKHAAIEQIVLE